MAPEDNRNFSTSTDTHPYIPINRNLSVINKVLRAPDLMNSKKFLTMYCRCNWAKSLLSRFKLMRAGSTKSTWCNYVLQFIKSGLRAEIWKICWGQFNFLPRCAYASSWCQPKHSLLLFGLTVRSELQINISLVFNT